MTSPVQFVKLIAQQHPLAAARLNDDLGLACNRQLGALNDIGTLFNILGL
jgi:hypothetical protein